MQEPLHHRRLPGVENIGPDRATAFRGDVGATGAVTWIAVVQLGPAEGLLREVFGLTREILRRYGPAVAPKTAEQEISFEYLAVGVLNGALRLLLAVWHPTLAAYEATRPKGGRRWIGSGSGAGRRSYGPSWRPPVGCWWSSPAPLARWPGAASLLPQDDSGQTGARGDGIPVSG